MEDKHLDCYAELLVKHAAGLQARQTLFVHATLAYRDFALRIGEAAYKAGARYVSYLYRDPLVVAQLIRHGGSEQIALYDVRTQAWYDEIISTGDAVILLDSPARTDFSEEMARTHPRAYSILNDAQHTTYLSFQARAVEQRLCSLVIAPVPTPAWGHIVFPDLSEVEAMDRLAGLLIRFVDADQPDFIERAIVRDRELKARAAALNQLQIREIHVTGAGNDFRVGFSPKARWHGGTLRTTAGQPFLPNVPSLEVATTPHARSTQGRLAASRPISLRSRAQVKELSLEFRQGQVVDFHASEGVDEFARLIACDEGANRLGEFALVGEDSPIAQSGIFFHYPNLDENAASHVALGQSLSCFLADRETSTPRELEEWGYNKSRIHLDIPFGSSEVDVVATDSREGEVILLSRGLWADRFAEIDGDGNQSPAGGRG